MENTSSKPFTHQIRGYGKSLYHYYAFIDSIKRGEKSIVFGDGYVVLSEKLYEKLKSEKINFPKGEK